MSQNLQNFVKFQKFQLDNLVDFEKCCKTYIFLQKSVPIQPKTSNILPKICHKLATTLRVRLPQLLELLLQGGHPDHVLVEGHGQALDLLLQVVGVYVSGTAQEIARCTLNVIAVRR